MGEFALFHVNSRGSPVKLSTSIEHMKRMLGSDLYVESRGTVLRRGLEAADDDLFIVNPTQATMRELVETISESPPATTVRLFADRQPLKDLVEDFLVASAVADLVAEEALAVRVLEDVPRNALLLGDDFVVSVVATDGQIAGLTSTDGDFVSTTFRYYRRRWRRADEYSLRTPPLSRIRSSLDDDIGPDAVADFDRVLDSLETARGNGQGLDEVTIALLVAANNNELLYDISQWGEDIRLASKATFSRTKNHLEEAGLIETEKVPIDVGRPRLRLLLGSSRLQAADIELVADRAQAKLG